MNDAPAIRTALAEALSAEDHESGPDRMAQEWRKIADLAILDVGMPVGPDGFTVCRRVRQMGDLLLRA